MRAPVARRGANRQLALSCRRPREDQARDVRAPNQQDEADSGHEHHNQSAAVGDGFVVHRRDGYGKPRDGLANRRRITVQERRDETGEDGARPFDRHAGLQTRDDGVVVHHAECLPLER